MLQLEKAEEAVPRQMRLSEVRSASAESSGSTAHGRPGESRISGIAARLVATKRSLARRIRRVDEAEADEFVLLPFHSIDRAFHRSRAVLFVQVLLERLRFGSRRFQLDVGPGGRWRGQC
jgi:hypothetical protein